MISIVIPTYNSANTIEDCLDAIIKEIKKSRENVEVIIVDDESKDDTIKLAGKYHVKIIKQRHEGPAKARNKGWRVSKGEIVIFLDSDCKVGKNWLKNILNEFKDEKVGGASVKYKTWNENSWVARFVGYETEQRHNKISKSTNFLASYSTAYRRNILEKNKGFDTSFGSASGEDNELSYRIKKMGYKLIFLKNTFVWHRHSESLIKYFRKQYNHAFWRVFLYYKRPEFIKGDEYAGTKTLIQTFLYVLFLFSLFLSKYFFLFLLFSLLLIHLPSIKIPLRRKDYKVAALIPFLFFIRGFVWLIGMIFGSIFLINKKLKE